MADPFGEKREAIEQLLARGWDDNRIAAAVPCSRTWVVGVRKELSLEPRRVLPLRDRIEQAIARGLDDATIAAQLGVEAWRVAGTRADVDEAAAEPRDGSYHARKAARCCVNCGQRLRSDDGVRCETHAEAQRRRMATADQRRRHADRMARVRTEKKARGECVDCPRPAGTGRARCEACQASARVHQARYLDRQEACAC